MLPAAPFPFPDCFLCQQLLQSRKINSGIPFRVKINHGAPPSQTSTKMGEKIQKIPENPRKFQKISALCFPILPNSRVIPNSSVSIEAVAPLQFKTGFVFPNPAFFLALHPLFPAAFPIFPYLWCFFCCFWGFCFCLCRDLGLLHPTASGSVTNKPKWFVPKNQISLGNSSLEYWHVPTLKWHQRSDLQEGTAGNLSQIIQLFLLQRAIKGWVKFRTWHYQGMLREIKFCTFFTQERELNQFFFFFFFLQEREQRLWRDLLKAAADKETTWISKGRTTNKS